MRFHGLLFVLLCTGAARADVLVVPTPAYPTPQDAVDAAVDGDTILVQPSGAPYPAFQVVGKGLAIIADGAPIELALVVECFAVHKTP